MAEETFRPERKKISTEELDDFEGQPEDGNEALAGVKAVRQAAAQDAGRELDEPLQKESSLQIKGKPPQGFLEALKSKKRGGESQQEAPRPAPRPAQQPQPRGGSSAELSVLLEGLKEHQGLYEPITLPSKGRFYLGDDGPTNGVLHLRAMTGEEEQILATPRFVRKGQAINMIFQRCMKEKYRAEDLLTIDRTYMLIWLRGISYTPEYDVEVKCQECEKKFSTVIDLNTLFVEECPDDFGPELVDVLPKTGYHFSYRLSRGRDETEIQEYRDRRIRMFGDASSDDTLTYRTALLLDKIEGVEDKKELQTLIKNLPIQDVAYIRGLVNEPPFGVDTNIDIACPSCLHEFQVDLPLEANFFFPRRKKKERNRA